MKTSINLAALALILLGLRAEAAAKTQVILIGWDGARRETVEALLAAGRLPNLQALVRAGTFLRTKVTTGATLTKPGWSEILTGYNAQRLGIISNRIYRPLPAGYTVFERLKARHGGRITTIFLSGKSYNTGHRGPHEVCMNCVARDPHTHRDTGWWNKGAFHGGTFDGLPPNWVKRTGEPLLHAAAALDLDRVALGSADDVGAEALKALSSYRDRSFFAFIHFQEPDEQGHRFGEGSRGYEGGLETADHWLGRIRERLKSLGIDGDTRVLVTSDHGMDERGIEHYDAPRTFLAMNGLLLPGEGDRKDVAATVLDLFGIPPAQARPPLEGRSLLTQAAR